MENNKIELLESIVSGSIRFDFDETWLLRLQDFYTGRKTIYINFRGLVELLKDLEDEINIDDILIAEDEEEKLDEIKNNGWY